MRRRCPRQPAAPPGAHRAGGFAVGTGRFPALGWIEARRSSIRHCGRRDLGTRTSLSNRNSQEASKSNMARAEPAVGSTRCRGRDRRSSPIRHMARRWLFRVIRSTRPRDATARPFPRRASGRPPGRLALPLDRRRRRRLFLSIAHAEMHCGLTGAAPPAKTNEAKCWTPTIGFTRAREDRSRDDSSSGPSCPVIEEASSSGRPHQSWCVLLGWSGPGAESYVCCGAVQRDVVSTQMLADIDENCINIRCMHLFLISCSSVVVCAAAKHGGHAMQVRDLALSKS
jgi:hypothetical protein